MNVPNPQCDGATALHLAIVYGNISDLFKNGTEKCRRDASFVFELAIAVLS